MASTCARSIVRARVSDRRAGHGAPTATAAWSARKGFTLSDATGDNTLAISLLFQPRIDLTWSPGASASADTVTGGLRVRRMLVILQGSVWRRDLTYRLRFNVAAVGTVTGADGTTVSFARPTLDDARVGYKITDAFQIAVGQYKVPYLGSFANVSVHDQAFAERSPLSDGERLGGINVPGLSWARDVGGHVHGVVNKGVFEYQVGLFNGKGGNVWQPRGMGALYVARVAVAPLGGFAYTEIDLEGIAPRIGLGVTGSVNRRPVYDEAGDRDGTDDDLRFGAEARFGARHLMVWAEGHAARRDPGPGDDPTWRYGATAQASYVAGIVAAIRYSRLDPDAGDDDDAVDVVEGAVSLYLPEDDGAPIGNRARLHLTWATALPQGGPPVHQATLGAWVGF